MSLATLIRRMTDAGSPPEAIAIAVEEIEAIQASLDARRAADRDRKRAQREAQKSANVTGHSEDSHGTVTGQTPPPNKETPQTPKEINPRPPAECARVHARARTLPDNWKPEPFKSSGQAGLIVARKPVGWIERELSKFKDHALQNRRLCADWNAAWRNWVKRADEYDEQQRTGRSRPDSNPTATALSRVIGSIEAGR